VSNQNRWWSIAFVTSDADSIALSQHGAFDVMHTEAVRALSNGLSGVGESEDVASVKLEVKAASAAEAKATAENLLSAGRRVAGLPPEVPTVAWVTPLKDDDASSVRFLEKAEWHLDDEDEADMVVVAAQIHLEIQVRTLIERAAEKDGPEWVGVLMNRRGLGNLNSEQVKDLLRALLGVEISDAPDWKDYKAHNVRRNAIVHEGQSVEPSEARASVKVVRALCIYLADAALRKATKRTDEGRTSDN
jgi:hypothetical protein